MGAFAKMTSDRRKVYVPVAPHEVPAPLAENIAKIQQQSLFADKDIPEKPAEKIVFDGEVTTMPSTKKSDDPDQLLLPIVGSVH